LERAEKTSVWFVLLNYKKAQQVLINIEGIFAQSGDFIKKIVIVDNSCSAEQKKILEQGVEKLQKKIENTSHSLQLKIAEKNLGYTKGNNWGMKQLDISQKNTSKKNHTNNSANEYICILNPDIVWTEKDTLKKLIQHFQENPQLGICAPKQINLQNNTREISVRKFPHFWLQIVRRIFLRNIPPFKKWVDEDEMRDLDPNITQEVDWVQSSFLLIRKDLWSNIGGFDEDYFLFMADTQLCIDAWRRGFAVQFFANAQVGADGIRCSEGGMKKFFTSWTLRQHFIDALKYARKNFWKKNPRKIKPDV
jgi:GT2 family glycosyltransferase